MNAHVKRLSKAQVAQVVSVLYILQPKPSLVWYFPRPISLVFRGFFSGYSGFPSSLKSTYPGNTGLQ